MTIIEQNDTHVLQLEWMGKRHGGWWLEFVDRSTGLVKIWMHQEKRMFKGMSIDHAERFMRHEPWQKMYKPGYAPVE